MTDNSPKKECNVCFEQKIVYKCSSCAFNTCFKCIISITKADKKPNCPQCRKPFKVVDNDEEVDMKMEDESLDSDVDTTGWTDNETDEDLREIEIEEDDMHNIICDFTGTNIRFGFESTSYGKLGTLNDIHHLKEQLNRYSHHDVKKHIEFFTKYYDLSIKPEIRFSIFLKNNKFEYRFSYYIETPRIESVGIHLLFSVSVFGSTFIIDDSVKTLFNDNTQINQIFDTEVADFEEFLRIYG